MATSLARQNFDVKSEEYVNQMINKKLYAAQVYNSMVAYFNRDNVALPGLCKYYHESAELERDHAFKLINYQNTRGAQVHLTSISAPPVEFDSAKSTVVEAISVHKDLNSSLVDVANFALTKNDPDLRHLIKGTFLPERVKAIKQLSDFATQLELVGEEGLGLYLWDKDLLENIKC